MTGLAKLQRFQPYPTYKDSSVEWLGQIPAHWTTKALKWLARLRAGTAITSESIEEVGDYPVFGGNGIRGFTSSYTHEGKYPLIGRQGALCGCVNFAAGKFWASEHAVVARPAQDVCPYWLAYLLTAMSLNSYSESAAQPGLAVDTVSALHVPHPSVLEQRAIVAFLDRETAKIDALVAKKERLIELLQEKRTVLITRSVTKGLDPTAPIKNSGVEWLGEIPADWEVTSLSQRLTRITYGFTNPMPIVDEGPYMLTAFDIGDGKILYETARHTTNTAFNLLTDKSRPESGDILITKDGTLGRVAVASGEPICINQSVALLRFAPLSVDIDFIQNMLRSAPYQERMVFEAGGTAIKHIYISRLAKMPVALPPLEEQRSIAKFASKSRKELDALIAKIGDAIDRLKEFRTALISAAVTGKMNLRGQAA